ncbi:hypothetical protein LOC71_06105 [Rhodopirellula sp. JC740]|uniref:Transmembrane protein n=1 Tax=Rhodopirellula halodulae TaxID=2894198 RepID=A0ABS8NE60_9BACT|nr:hypothetical protein [Rhodopirellula sp. JC740]MCC9641841.1 hypothetical protein [Rhodopirellula sp. JC740]
MTPSQRIARLQWLCWAVIAIGMIVQSYNRNTGPELVPLLLMSAGLAWFVTWSAIRCVLCPGHIWRNVVRVLAMAFGCVTVLVIGYKLFGWLVDGTYPLDAWENDYAVVSGTLFAVSISLIATMFWAGIAKFFRLRLRDSVSHEPISPAKVSVADLMLLTAAVAIHIAVARWQQQVIFVRTVGLFGPGVAFLIILMGGLGSAFLGWFMVLIPTWMSLARHWSLRRRNVTWGCFWVCWMLLAAVAIVGNWSEPDFFFSFSLWMGWIVVNIQIVRRLIHQHPNFIGIEWYRLPKAGGQKTLSQ